MQCFSRKRYQECYAFGAKMVKIKQTELLFSLVNERALLIYLRHVLHIFNKVLLVYVSMLLLLFKVLGVTTNTYRGSNGTVASLSSLP